MPIIGHACKMAYGWAIGERANTALALEVCVSHKRESLFCLSLILPFLVACGPSASQQELIGNSEGTLQCATEFHPTSYVKASEEDLAVAIAAL
jgi:hypothetical protein